jgi:8-oxo-dGTP pyrophosphatase MutT (NUDIX family)
MHNPSPLTEEIIDLLDDHGTIITPMPRSQLMESGSRNFRLASAFLRTQNGNFIMFRRAYTKKSFPGLFGTVGGCVETGEAYEAAFARKVYEEVGIDVHAYSWKLLGHTTPRQDNTIGHVAVYEVFCDPINTYNTDDFAEYRIFSFEELTDLCAQNKEVTHNTPILFKKFYQQKN